jgi:hypothetical protein
LEGGGGGGGGGEGLRFEVGCGTLGIGSFIEGVEIRRAIGSFLEVQATWILMLMIEWRL